MQRDAEKMVTADLGAAACMQARELPLADSDLVSSIMHDIWRVTDQVADDQFPWSEVAGCIRSTERYVGPKAEIHQQWIESLRRGL